MILEDNLWGNAGRSLYCIARCLQKMKGKEFQNLISSYCDGVPDKVLLVKNCGRGEDGFSPIRYVIAFGVDGWESRGLFALVKITLRMLEFAESLSMTPVVLWGKYTLYAEKEPVNGTENVMQYYFEPVGEVSFKDLDRCGNLVFGKVKDIVQSDSHEKYDYIDEQLAEKMAYYYKKYFKLNRITETYIKEEREKLLGEKKTLGIHIRGTDFKNQYNAHPHFNGFEEYLEAARKKMEETIYEQIFLATDDSEALRLFRQAFGGKLVYYEDASRASGTVGVHMIRESKRENHNYRLGLEVLRDVYTLTACDGLICGMSQVSWAARYIKLTEGGDYRFYQLIRTGINDNRNILDVKEYI